jgi:hypothetical protein
LGVLADNHKAILFEYAPEALRRGLDLSPRHLPLRAEAFTGFPPHQQRLPGLVADSLPDGWGMLLMDKLFRKQGRTQGVSPLDRLAFVGERGMGALSYVPPDPLHLTLDDLQLLDVAKAAQTIAQGRDSAILKQLVLLGGSPHGSRPKALVRFDREDGMWVPVHTLAGLLHIDFRLPSLDYSTFLRATRLMARDQRQVDAAFQRCVFNVVFNNRDDHAKNFSYRMDRDRHWRLSPCYDLSFNTGPAGEHQMPVMDESKAPGLADLLRLAADAGIAEASARDIVDRTATHAGAFALLASDAPIRAATVRSISRSIGANRDRMA